MWRGWLRRIFLSFARCRCGPTAAQGRLKGFPRSLIVTVFLPGEQKAPLHRRSRRLRRCAASLPTHPRWDARVRKVLQSAVPADWRDTYHMDHFGWENDSYHYRAGSREPSPRRWLPGTYRVDLYVANRKVSSGSWMALLFLPAPTSWRAGASGLKMLTPGLATP
jgi:hypothetical protein